MAAIAPRAIGGVVDSQLKVYRTKNLRVVDASVILLQLGTMPMSTTYVIAEKVISPSCHWSYICSCPHSIFPEPSDQVPGPSFAGFHTPIVAPSGDD